jgi:hypothetical protein
MESALVHNILHRRANALRLRRVNCHIGIFAPSGLPHHGGRSPRTPCYNTTRWV